jgi:hypothetical protein
VSPFDTLKIFAGAGGAGGLVGAITHDQLLTWTGATIAAGSMVVTAALTGYHKLREARRAEDLKDRAAGIARLATDRHDELLARVVELTLATHVAACPFRTGGELTHTMPASALARPHSEGS